MLSIKKSYKISNKYSFEDFYLDVIVIEFVDCTTVIILIPTFPHSYLDIH